MKSLGNFPSRVARERYNNTCLFCRRDYVNISYEQGQKFKEYCGNKTGHKIQVTGNNIMIKFHSDDSHQKRGFLIYFTAIPLREYYSFWQRRDIWYFPRLATFNNKVYNQFGTSVLLNKNSLELFLSCAPPPPPPAPHPI